MDTSSTNQARKRPQKHLTVTDTFVTTKGKHPRCRKTDKPKKKARIDLRLADCPVNAIVKTITEQFGDPKGLPNPIFSFAYEDEVSIQDAYDSYLAYSLMRKHAKANDKAQAALCRDAALDKWYAAERQCAVTNIQFESIEFLQTLTPLQKRTLQRVKELLRTCLGEEVKLSLLDNYRFGPGMSLSSRNAEDTTPYFKVSEIPLSVTSGIKPLALKLIARSACWWSSIYTAATHTHLVEIPPYECRWRWLKTNEDRLFVETNASKLTFVPKDATTDRPIAIEPALNLPVQLAVDAFMRKRLRQLWEVELNSQSVNQQLARLGSSYPSWIQPCTIDLSSASDCMSTALVEYLLPPEWFAFLSDLRCEYSSGRDLPSAVHLNKFSSMGNGFTFALESLLFYSIARAATEVAGSDVRVVHIHGDDIIVPRASALLCVEVLQICGFTLNSQKTFLTGNFRESCGHDYYRGENIRPPLVKGDISDARDVVKILNGLRNRTFADESRLSLALYERLMGCLPAFFRRLCGPSNGDDGHIHTAPHLYLACSKLDENRTPWYMSLTDVPIDWSKRIRRHADYNQYAHYASMLYSIGSAGFGSAITRRKSVRTTLKPKPVLGTSLLFEEKRSFDRILAEWMRRPARRTVNTANRS